MALMQGLTFPMQAILGGLMVIYCIKLFGIDALTYATLGTLDPAADGFADTFAWASATAGTAMAVYALLNGLGRIVWGMVSDYIGRRISIILMTLLQGIMLAMLAALLAGIYPALRMSRSTPAADLREE